MHAHLLWLLLALCSPYRFHTAQVSLCRFSTKNTIGEDLFLLLKDPLDPDELLLVSLHVSSSLPESHPCRKPYNALEDMQQLRNNIYKHTQLVNIQWHNQWIF